MLEPHLDVVVASACDIQVWVSLQWVSVYPFPDKLKQWWVDSGGGGPVSLSLCIGEV